MRCSTSIRAALLALLSAAVLGTLPSPAHATEFGLSEQQAASFADGRVRALGLRYARLIAPWNAATSEPDRVQAWLDAVAAAGMAPHVAFEHLRSDHCPGRPCVLPSRADYRAAIEAFRARFPQVTTFTTWNEANHSSQPVASRPEVVAGYWAELKAACPGCTIVAGDVLDSGGYVRWLERFAAAAPSPPERWGLHNYGDVTYAKSSGTDAVLAAVSGELWIEETGGIVTLRNSAGRVTLSTDEARAAASVNRAFDLVATRPRVTRMYLYHWKAGSLADRFDAGLARPDGSLRPSYWNVVAKLAASAAAAAAPPPEASPEVTVTARWSKVKRNQLLLRVRCNAASRVCRGRLAATIRTKWSKRSERWLAKKIAKRRTYKTSMQRRTITLRLNVSAPVRARVRRAKLRRVVVTARSTVPVRATGTTTRRLPPPAAPR